MEIKESEKRQENKAKKDYLNRYRGSKQKEKRILEQIQRLREDEMFSAVQYDDMPHGSNTSDLSDYAVKLDDLLMKLKEERLEAITRYAEIHRQIKKVNDCREQDILTYRYLLGERWEDVCGIMGLSWMQTHRIHARALENFKMV